MAKVGDEYQDGMVEHDLHVGELLKLLDELQLTNNTIVLYSTDNGPTLQYMARCRHDTVSWRKEFEWEGAYRVPAFVRWPGKFPCW